VRDARMPPGPQLAMDANITAFEDVLGTCERILRTPIPLSYTRCVCAHLGVGACVACVLASLCARVCARVCLHAHAAHVP
jgi:predicted membrane chloride channel (bestrophin family)